MILRSILWRGVVLVQLSTTSLGGAVADDACGATASPNGLSQSGGTWSLAFSVRTTSCRSGSDGSFDFSMKIDQRSRGKSQTLEKTETWQQSSSSGAVVYRIVLADDERIVDVKVNRMVRCVCRN